VRYSYDEFRRLNNQMMMGKDYQLVHTDQDEAIDALIYPSRSAVRLCSFHAGDRLSTVTIPSVGTTTYTYDIKSSGETNTVSYPGQPNAMQKTISSFAEITGMNHADGWSETNGYDLFGNITSQKRGGATYGTFAYDRRGNRQAYANAPADSTRSYELKHDLLNRLTEYKDDKGTTTYTYYPGGLRATKQQTGTVTDTTHYVYLNGQVIEELTQDGRVKARNVFGNQLIWRKDYTTNQEGTYYHNSHGDVVKIKGPSGNVLNTYEYDIWSNLLADKVKEAMPNPFAYAGEMYDKESGFYYLRARYYDPKMGRFISEDTYKGQVDNPLSLNRYTYVHNNPLRFVDPSGHSATIGGDGATGTYFYYDKAGVRRIHGTQQIDYEYYDDLFYTKGIDAIPNSAGLHDLFRGSARELEGFEDPTTYITGAAGILRGMTKSVGLLFVSLFAAGGKQEGIEVSEQLIKNVMKDASLKTQQGAVSLPAVQRYVQRLLNGEVPPAIKVSNGIIVDGNHRYIASRIVGKEIDQVQWSGGRLDQVIDWIKLKIDPTDWGNK
ncbi:RHS repeat-associated core domain-containing protein, partial [Brevibacillus parabrevis]|uniref:RHS repeat-associated core domain-containing protein n=1 Tax=Brevibacillus parabrevis TaxID=54914 RepID=UPI000A800412